VDDFSSSPKLFRFGVFEADVENATLTRKGIRIRLQDQPFRILTTLLEHAGQIVTRDDLRQRLWPTGTYVDFEGSLNAALKRLRASLDDDADNPRFVETVPKRGYRFIAPVVAVAKEAAESSTNVVQPNAIRRAAAAAAPEVIVAPSNAGGAAVRSRTPFRVAAIGAFVVAASIAGIIATRKLEIRRFEPATHAAIVPVTQRQSVAVLGFHNASGRNDDSWLSTALTEMLRTELGAGDKLRVVSGEDVTQFRLASPWSETDSLSQATASRIGKALEGDMLVIGSYTTIGESQTENIRIDYRLQNAQSGEILYEGEETGAEKQFFGLVAKVGVALRERLGLPVVTESEEVGVLSSLPSDQDADRLYSLGLEKLNTEDVATAKDLFVQAEQIAPDFPLLHLALSRAWGALGYDQKSSAEAKKAFDLSGSLSETDKLVVQAAYYGSLKNPEKVATVYRTLFSLYPDNVEYGISLAGTLHAVGRREEALAIIKQLRQLPPPASDDPRIDFAQAKIISDTNIPEAYPLVDSAVSKAAAQGQKLLYARFRLQQCIARVYGPHPQGAEAYCQEAYDIFIAAGNTLLAADALRTMGDRRGAEGNPSGAREFYNRALALLGKLGEHEKTGVVLNNMALSYENQGQIDQAEKLLKQAVQTWTECGDTHNAAVALGNLADISMARGQLHVAEQQYENARKQIEVANEGEAAYELYSIAAIRLYEGDVAGAQSYADQGLAVARNRVSMSDIAGATAVVGDIRMAKGDLPGARQAYQQALALCQQMADQGSAAENQAALANVSIEEGNLPDAEAALRKSLTEFQAEKATMNEISAEADLSRALLMERKLDEAAKFASDAVESSRTSRDPNLRLPAAIADARVKTARSASTDGPKPDFSGPRAELQGVISTAHQLGYFELECEARLGLAEIELRTAPAEGRSHLAAIAGQAHEHGLELVARRASAMENSAALAARSVSKR